MPSNETKQLNDSGRAVVLFADICDSTSLYRRLGDEAALELIKGLLQRCEDVSRPLGGVVIKTIGDEIMLSFPDPFTAVTAAVGMQHAADSFGSQACTPLFLRIGVNAGEIQHDKGDMFGNTVNLAARLVAFASPGKIVTSKEIMADEQCRQVFEFRVIGTYKLKGIDEPVECCEVLWDMECMTISIKRPAFIEKPKRMVISYGDLVFEVGEAETVTIGRGNENTIRIDCPDVSRHHGAIEGKFTTFSLSDRSTNSTYVYEDGMPVVKLNHGSCTLSGSGRIVLGQEEDVDNRTTLVYRIVS